MPGLYDPLPEWKKALTERHGKVFSLEPESGALFRVAQTGERLGFSPDELCDALTRWHNGFAPACGPRVAAIACEQTLLAQMLARGTIEADEHVLWPTCGGEAQRIFDRAAVFALNAPRWLANAPAFIARKLPAMAVELRAARAVALMYGAEAVRAIDALAPALAALLAALGAGAVELHAVDEPFDEPVLP